MTQETKDECFFWVEFIGKDEMNIQKDPRYNWQTILRMIADEIENTDKKSPKTQSPNS